MRTYITLYLPSRDSFQQICLLQYHNGGDGTPSFRNYYNISNYLGSVSDSDSDIDINIDSDSGDEVEEMGSDDNSDSEDEQQSSFITLIYYLCVKINQ